MLRIELESENGVYRPGETINGRVVWELMSTVPKKMFARLRWQTEGKGTDDHETIEEMEWIPSSESGEQAFVFVVPRAPLSLDGRLLRINWYIDAEASKPKEKISRNIVVGYQSTPILLREVK